MPTTIAVAAASAAASMAISGTTFTLLAFAKAVGVSLLLSGASKLLAPKPQKPSLAYDSTARTQSIRQPIAAWRVVYGTDRIGGAMTFAAADESANSLGVVITLAGHTSRAIREVYFNDEWVPVVGNNGAPSPYPPGVGNGNVNGRYNGNVFIELALGDEVGQPFPVLEANSAGKWTSAHRQAGHTKLHVRCRRNREVFPGGLPNITALVDGVDDIYDPRTDTYGWTTNSALIVAHYLTNTTFGYGADWSKIDEDALIEAANICDERVTSTYQPEFTVDAGTDSLLFASDEKQFVTGDAVKYVSTGGAAGGLTSGALYYFIRTAADEGQLATTRDNALALIAIELSSAGSGVQTLERMPVVTADAATDRLTFEYRDDRLFTGDGVQVETSGTLPSGISAATTYYAIRISGGEIQLATSYANAMAGTAINITSSGSGVHRLKLVDEVRYATNGSFTLDMAPRDIITQLTDSMAGRTVKIGGTWRIIAGAYTAPAITLTDTHMAGPRKVQVMQRRDRSANGVKGVYVGPENFYQPTDFIPASNSSYVTADNGEEVWRDIQLPMIRRHSLARRLAKIELERIRQSLTVVLECKISAYECQPGDIIGVTVSKYGWSNKAFEVLNARLVLRGDGDNTRLGVDLTLRETASGIFGWTAVENDGLDIAPNTSLPDPFERARVPPPPVSGLEIFGQGNDTVFTGRDCKFAWRHSARYGYFDIGAEPLAEGANAGAPDWFVDGYRVRIYDTSGNLLREEPLQRGVEYIYSYEKNFEDNAGVPLREFEIRVWTHTTLGQESATYAGLTVSNPQPALPTAVALRAAFRTVFLEYTPPNDTDWAGVLMWMSTSTGFTPSGTQPGTGNCVYAGTDQIAVIDGLSGTTYYVRYASFDSFGRTGLTTSGELSVATATIAEVDLAPLSVTTGKLADLAVELAKIANGAVDTNKIAANAVTTAKLSAGAVTANEIAAGAVTTAKITAGAVTANEIASNAITTAKITAGAVTANEIATDAVVAAKIQAGAVTTAKLAANAVTANEIAANAVTTAKIQAGAITAASAIIADATIATAKIIDANITTLKVAGNAITVPVSAFTAATTSVSNTGTQIQSVTITTSGDPVKLIGHFAFHDSGGVGPSEVAIQINRGGTLLTQNKQTVPLNGWAALGASVTDTPGAGTYTYYLISNFMDGEAEYRSLEALEVHR